MMWLKGLAGARRCRPALTAIGNVQSPFLGRAILPDIHWLMTNKELEEEFHPIRIPLYKGLIGWRVFLIQPQDQVIFSDISSVEELQHLPTAQGHDWPDTKILIHNKLPVYSSPSWNGLFEMLKKGRIRYFPRSAIEIYDEFAQLSKGDIGIEETLVLRYPAAYYFFVHKDQKALGEEIEAALEHMHESGEFDQIFNRHFAYKLEDLELHKRRQILIDNPNMHPDTPSLDSHVWYGVDSQP
jgi:hypothetical protein